MESTELWDIKSSEGYIYAAFKLNQKMVRLKTESEAEFGFWTDFDAFPPWHAASEFLTNSRPVYDFIPSF